MLKLLLSGQALDPDAGGRGFAKVNGAAHCAQSHRFVVLALDDFYFRCGTQMQSVQEFQELPVFFINAKNFSALIGTQIRKQHRALFTELGDSTAHGNSVRATFLVAETLQEQRFDFWGDGVFEALRFVVRFGPRKANHFREQHFSKLMAKRQTLRDRAAFLREIDAPGTLDTHEAVARHTFQSSRYCGRSDAQFLCQTRADWRVVFLKHLPDGLEVV